MPTTQDTKQIKNLENQLIHCERLASLGLLVGGIAHELSNPISGILLFSQVLQKELPKNSPHLQDVKEIEIATKRCVDLLAELLNYAQKDQISKEVNTAIKIDCVESMLNAIRFARFHKNYKKIEIEKSFELEHAFILGQDKLLIQLFLNPIQNAIQAMPKGGHLEIRNTKILREEKSYIRWSIKDSGQGISKENLTHIFEAFYTSKKTSEGTGLGLSICKNICKDIGGEIEIESKVGQGTSCHILLPLTETSEKKT